MSGYEGRTSCLITAVYRVLFMHVAKGARNAGINNYRNAWSEGVWWEVRSSEREESSWKRSAPTLGRRQLPV